VRRRLPLVLALLLGATGVRAETGCEVTAEQWSRPRSAAMVVALPGVRECVARWLADPRQRLVIVHAAGEEGALWASELRDWLVALGVPGAHLRLRAVGANRARVVLRIEPPVG
jgi:hypothetical protein